SQAANPEWAQAIQPGYDLYEAAVASAFPGLEPAGLRSQAAFCWATIHGLALLRMHGRLQRFTRRGDSEADLVRNALDRLLPPGWGGRIWPYAASLAPQPGRASWIDLGTTFSPLE